LGLDEKTIIIITSDHGQEFYEHHGWMHGQSLYDELSHVPLIIFYPERQLTQKRIKGIVSHVDILPSLCSLCGFPDFKLSYEIEGMDLSPEIRGEDQTVRREYAFSELHKGGLPSHSLRTISHKAIVMNFGTQMLRQFFDLSSDPLEMNNIHEDGKLIEKGLFDEMEALAAAAKKRAFQSPGVVLDERTKEKLRALGYIK
jgi:arylsulfatase A-like enzyme